MQFKKAFLLLGMLALAGCSSNSMNPNQNPSGFLPDYSVLQPMTNPPEGTQVYTYKNPNVQRGTYHAVVIDPVVIYQTATTNGVTDTQISGAQAAINQNLANIVSQQMPVTNSAGTGVARLSVAITGAEVDGQSFKVRNVIPVSAAIYLASKATNLDSKTPALMIELKFTDSVSGQLLKETVTIIKGDSFRLSGSTSDEFSQLAQQWIKQAMQYSSAQAASSS